MKTLLKLTFSVCILALKASVLSADCVEPTNQEEQKEVTHIVNSFYPVFDGTGAEVPGCILELADGARGYTAYKYLCHLNKTESIELTFGKSCCDTGLDSGELPCTVRANKFFGLIKIRAKGLSIEPSTLDERAIQNLIEILESKNLTRIHSEPAGRKLIKLLVGQNHEQVSQIIFNQKPFLEKISKDENLHPNQRAFACRLIMEIPNIDYDEMTRCVMIMREFQPLPSDQAIPIPSLTLPSQTKN